MPRNRTGSTGSAGDVLSTKEAANICKVALSTIVYWFDKGLIRGYRTPGGHRRIFRADLEKFMIDHAIPLGHRLDDRQRVLVVGQDPEVMGLFEGAFKAMNGHVDWATAKEGFQAGRLVATFRPNLLLLDVDSAGLDGEQLVRQLKSDPETMDIQVVVITPQSDNDAASELRDAGAADVLTKPLSAERLEKIVSGLLA